MPSKPIVILDSNELILGLKGSNPNSKILVDNLSELNEIYDFRISEDIFEEIIRNIIHNTKEEFIKILNVGILKRYDLLIDKALINKYKSLGLKKGDIYIAAFAEQANANFLITENRHFLKELKTRKFKIVNAEQFLKYILN